MKVSAANKIKNTHIHTGKSVFFQLNTTVLLTQDNFSCQTFMLRFDYICSLAEERATNVSGVSAGLHDT